MALDTAKLTKLLNLTTSSNDAEALAAIRAANRMLADERILWDGVFAGAFRQAQVEVEAHEASIDEMIEDLLGAADTVPSSTVAFVESLQLYYRKEGYLTKRQRENLERTWERWC